MHRTQYQVLRIDQDPHRPSPYFNVINTASPEAPDGSAIVASCDNESWANQITYLMNTNQGLGIASQAHLRLDEQAKQIAFLHNRIDALAGKLTSLVTTHGQTAQQEAS